MIRIIMVTRLASVRNIEYVINLLKLLYLEAMETIYYYYVIINDS